MKKLILALTLFASAALAQTNYIVSLGAGVNNYNTPATFGYLAYAKPIGMNSYAITSVDLLGRASTLRTGFGHDVASLGKATLFALGDAGMINTSEGNTGLSLSGGGGIKAPFSAIPGVKRFFTSDNIGFVGTVLVKKNAVQDPAVGITSINPSFTGGIYIKFN